MSYCQVGSEIEKVSDHIIWTIDNLQIPENAAIVYDIDDTLIATDGSLLHPIVKTYHYAKSKGIQTVIVTNRIGSQDGINYTHSQLSHFGLGDNNGLYMRPPDKNNPWVFKEAARRNVHERGMNVILSIGDQPWDIGNYGGVGFIVPTQDPKVIPQYFPN